MKIRFKIIVSTLLILLLLTKTGTVPVLSSEVKANQINDCKISYIDINDAGVKRSQHHNI